ncbi:MAG: DUF1887 family CARF protein [Pseudomonadota bacterium]
MPSDATVKIHFCLVSEQPLANLLAALDREHGCQRAVLAVSPQMQEQAVHQARVLRGYGREVELLQLPSAYEFDAMAAAFDRWLDHMPPDAQAELNATGGTKLMALAAQDVFRRRALAVFYVNEASGQVVYFDGRKPGYRLSKVMEMRAFIAAHGGHEVSRREGDGLVRPDLADLSNHLGRHAPTYSGALMELKRALSALDGLRSRQPCKGQSNRLRELLALLENHTLLRVDRGLHVHLAREDVFGYLSGGWLEDYTLLSARAVGGLNDVVASLKFASGAPTKTPSDGTLSRNEMDVAWLSDNRLYALECKTMTDPAQYHDVIYKAAFQRWLGGHSTRIGMVGLMRPTPLLQDRARAARIRLFGLDDLPQLTAAFADWVRPRG